MTDNKPIDVRILPESIDVSKMIISAGLSIGLAVAVIWIQRKAMEPDFFLTLKMRSLVTVQEYANNRAKFWLNLSSKASSAYLASRSVS